MKVVPSEIFLFSLSPLRVQKESVPPEVLFTLAMSVSCCCCYWMLLNTLLAPPALPAFPPTQANGLARESIVPDVLVYAAACGWVGPIIKETEATIRSSVATNFTGYDAVEHSLQLHGGLRSI